METGLAGVKDVMEDKDLRVICILAAHGREKGNTQETMMNISITHLKLLLTQLDSCLAIKSLRKQHLLWIIMET